MPEIKLSLTADQWEVITNTATMKVVTCGRRYGKTTMAKGYLVKVALENRNSESSYVGKTYKLAYKMYCSIYANPALKPHIRSGKLQPTPHITWRNGHTTWFFSGDRPDNLRGDGLVLCIVDEAAHVSERLINEVLQPAMLDCGGTIVLVSTFRGRNFYYNWHAKGMTWPNDDDCKSWLRPTSASIWAQGDEGQTRLRRMKSRLPEMVWKQECECIVDENQAAVFKNDNIIKCTGGTPRGPQAGFGYVLAYDSGKTADPGAIVILECSPMSESCSVVFVEELPLGMEYTLQVDRVVALARQYRSCVMVDSTGAGTRDAIIDFIKKAAPEIPAYGVQIRGDAPQNMVRQCEYLLERSAVLIPAEFGSLLSELRMFEYEYTQRGYYRYHAPEGEHDDLVWALLMAIEGKKKRLFRVPSTVAPRPAPGSQGDVFYKQRHRIEETTERL